MRGLLDGRTDTIAQRRADLRPPVDHHDAQLGLVAEDGAQARGQFGGGFDSGEAAACHHHGVAGRGFGLLGERLEVLLQARGTGELVDIEHVLDTDHVGAVEHAATGHDQAVIGQLALSAGGGAVVHALGRFVHLVGGAPDETDIHGLEQGLQRRGHGVHFGLVETWAHMQFGLGREQGHGDILAAVQIQLADGAEGAPQAGKACADNQDVLHCRAPGGSGETQ
ncbi:hypothetical protein D3C76_1155510 [compost metagenome]